MKNIQAIIIGFGMVGGNIVKNSFKKGVDYVGIFDVNPDMIGKPAGNFIHEPELKTLVSPISELETFLQSHELNLAINTAAAPMERTLDLTRMVLANRVNVLTSLADIYTMKTHFPEMYAELNALAEKNQVSFFASGIQDVFWTSLPIALTGCSLEITEIKGTNIALIDSFGPGVADECYVGWNLDAFNKANESGQLPTNDFLIALYELVNKLGLHVTSESSTLKPLTAKKDTYYETIDRHIKKGQLLGNYVESRITTEEGIELACDFVSKMSEEGDTDLNKWEIKGVPAINIITEHMQGEITTESNIINRIPDVINAASGVISASQMPAPFFKVKKLNEYIV